VRRVLHPEADEEFLEAVRYYAGIGSELGNQFYDEIERLIAEVCAQPQRFRQFDPPARRHFFYGIKRWVVQVEQSGVPQRNGIAATGQVV